MRAALYVRILLTTLGLVTFATSASAECAWVLWNSFMSTKTSEIEHIPARAFESKVECDAAMYERMDRDDAWRKANPGKSGPPAGRDAVGGFLYTCWPSGLDPRGPKGGAR